MPYISRARDITITYKLFKLTLLIVLLYYNIGRVEDIQYSSVSSVSVQSECRIAVQYLNELSAILHRFAQLYGDKAMEIEDMSSGPDTLIQCPVSRSGGPGRPSIIISKAQIEILIELGYNYTTIARICLESVQEHSYVEEVTTLCLLVVHSLKSAMVTLIQALGPLLE